MTIDVDSLRDEFPVLRQEVYGRRLIYLDNAATTQKPSAVIDAIRHYYEYDNANVHRGVHALSERATAGYERAREKLRDLINAASVREIVFTRGTTEAINLVASSWGDANVRAGDEILISEMEHHSDIVPWQLLCERRGARLVVAPISDRGELLVEEFKARLSERTRLVGIVHLSNSLGTINPVAGIVALAHDAGAKVLVDGAQALAHLAVDVRALGADFYVSSAHKMYGPTGIGFLYAKSPLLEDMPPYQGGGDMISHVTFEKTLYNETPFKFEAGTPNIAGAIGYGAAVDWLNAKGVQTLAQHEQRLLAYASQRAEACNDLRVIGTAANKATVLSFILDGIHAHDLGTILDREGIAIRAGHHCTMPVMQHFRVPATARASFAAYNTFDEIDVLFDSLDKAREVFR
ncbi:MAG: SufS family cysteine desulfurase [Gammaproteobacteria bacterium]|nr:SufS family cysteine desulfurase [Gammaproteobacteria bacterium]